jgi:outer membrane receptor for ferrienterochelin and colicins
MHARTRISFFFAALFTAFSIPALTQDATEDGATVTYPASYFAEYGAVSVNDMLNRIPGINIALEGNQVPSGLSGGNDRGLGGNSQILINGKRLAGKANEASSQLERIAADQVDYIEIIRGNSGDLDVSNSGQLVNIVLFETQPTSSLSAELGLTQTQDGTLKPLGSFSYSGQAGKVNYLLSADVSSRYEFYENFETSLLADHSLN